MILQLSYVRVLIAILVLVSYRGYCYKFDDLPRSNYNLITVGSLPYVLDTFNFIFPQKNRNFKYFVKKLEAQPIKVNANDKKASEFVESDTNCKVYYIVDSKVKNGEKSIIPVSNNEPCWFICRNGKGFSTDVNFKSDYSSYKAFSTIKEDESHFFYYCHVYEFSKLSKPRNNIKNDEIIVSY